MKQLLTIFLLLAFITACNNKHTPEMPEVQATNKTLDANKAIANFDTTKIKGFKDCWDIYRWDYSYGNRPHSLSKSELLQFQDLAIQIPFTSIYINALNQTDTTVFETRGSLYSTLKIQYNITDTNYLSKLVMLNYGGVISAVLPNNAYNEEYYKLTPFKEQDNDTIVITFLNKNYGDTRQMTEYYFTKKQNIWGVFKKIDAHFSPETLAENKNEQFDKFLLRFDSDSSFRLNRIKFPLKVYSADADFDTIVYIKKNSTDLNFYIGISALFCTNHKNIQLNEANNVVLYRDAEVATKVYFKKINNKWILYKCAVMGG